MRLLHRCTFFGPLCLSLYANLLIRSNVLAQNASSHDSRFQEPQKLKYDPEHNIDPLIAAVVVKTYNRLNIKTFESDTIFREGHLMEGWDGCGSNGVQVNHCKVIPTYIDRLSIEYTFDRNRLDEYTLYEPSIESRTSGASAELNDFSFRDDLRFTIVFQCERQETTSSIEVFDLTIPILKEFAIKTALTKNCTSGAHPYVHFGVVKDGVPQIFGSPLKEIYVSPAALTSDFFIQVSPPAESQIHRRPTLNSSNSGIKASLRGIADEETIIAGEDLKFSVFYDCNANGQAHVDLVVPIPPWRELRVKIRKMCGGRVPEMLSIGTTFEASDIVKNGTATPIFAVSNSYEMDIGNFELGEDSNTLRLYLRNTDSDDAEGLHLGRMHFTISDTSVLAVTAGRYGIEAISLLSAGRLVKEKVKFVCRKKGSATVIISIPVLQYEVLDFSVKKKCRDPISFKESGIGSWWTVVGVEDIAITALVAMLFIWCIWVRRKHSAFKKIRSSQHRLVMSAMP